MNGILLDVILSVHSHELGYRSRFQPVFRDSFNTAALLASWAPHSTENYAMGRGGFGRQNNGGWNGGNNNTNGGHRGLNGLG